MKNRFWTYYYIYKPYLFFTSQFGITEYSKSGMNKIFRIFTKILTEIYYLCVKGTKGEKQFKDQIIFVALTNNQFLAIQNIQKSLKNSFIFSPLLFSGKLPGIKQIFINRLPYFWEFFFQSYFLLKILRKDYFKLFIIGFYNAGFYSAYRRILSRNKPKAIVFTNDVHPHIRSLIKAAKELKIPTIFIQHSVASKMFPIIDYDNAFLEGKFSLDTYKIGNLTKVKLVGMSKFDNFSLNINSNTVIRTIGVAINVIDDDSEKVKNLFGELRKIQGLRIIFRPHPSRVNEDFSFDWDEFSHPIEEDSFTFLSNIDALVSGNSSIHQEAALLDLTCFHLDLTKNNYHDYYDFIKNNIAIPSSVEAIKVDILKNMKNRYRPFEKMKYYNDVVGTVNFGRSTDLIVNEISKIVMK